MRQDRRRPPLLQRFQMWIQTCGAASAAAIEQCLKMGESLADATLVSGMGANGGLRKADGGLSFPKAAGCFLTGNPRPERSGWTP